MCRRFLGSSLNVESLNVKILKAPLGAFLWGIMKNNGFLFDTLIGNATNFINKTMKILVKRLEPLNLYSDTGRTHQHKSIDK